MPATKTMSTSATASNVRLVITKKDKPAPAPITTTTMTTTTTATALVKPKPVAGTAKVTKKTAVSPLSSAAFPVTDNVTVAAANVDGTTTPAATTTATTTVRGTSTVSSANSVGLCGEEELEYDCSAPTSLKELRRNHASDGGREGILEGGDAAQGNTEKNASNCNLFIRGLSMSMDQAELDTHFAPFGKILSSAVMRNIHTGESLGTAFVRFEQHEEAKAAMEALNNERLGDRVISVQWAKKQEGAPVGEARKKILKLFVRNIPTAVSVEDLKELFSPYGPVVLVTIHKDTAAATVSQIGIVTTNTTTNTTATTNNNSGFSYSGADEERATGGANEALMNEATSTERHIAFITYEAEGAAEQAATAVHNTKPFATCHGIPLMVKLAEDTPNRTNRNGYVAGNVSSARHTNVKGNYLHPSNQNTGGVDSAFAVKGNSAGMSGALPLHMGMLAAGTMPMAQFAPQSDTQAGNRDSMKGHYMLRHNESVGLGTHFASDGGGFNLAGYSYNSFPNNLATHQQQPVPTMSMVGQGGMCCPSASSQQQHQPPPFSGQANTGGNMGVLWHMASAPTGFNQPLAQAWTSPNTSMLLGRSAPVAPPGSRPFNAPPPQQQYGFAPRNHPQQLPPSQQQWIPTMMGRDTASVPQPYLPYSLPVNGMFPLTNAPYSLQQQYAQQQQQQQQSSGSVLGAGFGSGHSRPATPVIYNSTAPDVNSLSAAATSRNATDDTQDAGGAAGRRNFTLPAPRSFQVNPESSFVLKHKQAQHPEGGHAGTSAVPLPPPQQQLSAGPSNSSFYGDNDGTQQQQQLYGASPTTDAVQARHGSLSNPALILRAQTAKIATVAEVRQRPATTAVMAAAIAQGFLTHGSNANVLASGGSDVRSRQMSGLSSGSGSMRVYRHNPYAPLTTVDSV